MGIIRKGEVDYDSDGYDSASVASSSSFSTSESDDVAMARAREGSMFDKQLTPADRADMNEKNLALYIKLGQLTQELMVPKTRTRREHTNAETIWRQTMPRVSIACAPLSYARG